MLERAHHVFLDCASRDSELLGRLSMGQAIELVQPEDLSRPGWKDGERLDQALKPQTSIHRGLGVRRIRDVGSVQGRVAHAPPG